MSVQNLRGLAVLLLVAGHVYGLGPNEGMRQPAGSVGHYLTDSLEYLRMPLFTVISGYVYALRPVTSTGALGTLVKGKARRLLLPLIPLTALVGGLQMASGSVNGQGAVSAGDIAQGYLYGYSHLWFLYAIFLVFAVVGTLGALGWLSQPHRWLATWVVAAVAYVAIAVPDRYTVFSIDGALRLLPFFLLGYAIKHFPRVLAGRPVVAVAATVFAVSFLVDQAVLLTGTDLSGTASRALAVVVGSSGILCLFRLRHLFHSALLGWIGTYAFTVYLLHTMANKAVKIGLGLVGVDAEWAVFGAGVIAAIGLPILFHVTAGRWNPVRVVLLGEKPREPVAPRPARTALTTGDAAAGEDVRSAA
jgi:fucose 4-O-acetylase-like acetyltransferase